MQLLDPCVDFDSMGGRCVPALNRRPAAGSLGCVAGCPSPSPFFRSLGSNERALPRLSKLTNHHQSNPFNHDPAQATLASQPATVQGLCTTGRPSRGRGCVQPGGQTTRRREATESGGSHWWGGSRYLAAAAEQQAGAPARRASAAAGAGGAAEGALVLCRCVCPSASWMVE